VGDRLGRLPDQTADEVPADGLIGGDGDRVRPVEVRQQDETLALSGK